MDFLKKLSLYWRLVEIDIHDSEKTVSDRTGESPSSIVTNSKPAELQNIVTNIKHKQGGFEGINDSNLSKTL